MSRPRSIGFARRSVAGLLLLAAACGPVTISEITPTAPPTTAAPPTATPSLTPLPTYAPPTDTPTPTLTPTPDPGDAPTSPTVHTAEESEAALKNSAEIPLLVNDILKETRLGTRSEPLELIVRLDTSAITWDNWWCAATDATLSGNLAVMQFKYEVNGEEIDPNESAFAYKQYLQNGAVCQVTAFYLSDWPAGEHELKYTFTFTGNVNDGFQVYGPGDYVTIYRVTAP